MQIRAITVNAAGMAPERSIQGNRNQVQQESNVFGAECRVTISREGRNLSRQQTAQAEKSMQDTQNTQSVRAEKMLLRRQEEAEQSKKIRDGYREELKEIENKISALNGSYPALFKVGDDVLEKEQEVLRAMRNQKQTQLEENQKRAKEAQQMAMQSAEYQEEINENNRDLLTLLKAMEEAEKAEENRENGEAKDDSSGEASGAKRSVSDIIENSATQFMTSSVKRQWGVEELLGGLGDDGRELLKLADTITQNVLDEVKNIRTAMNDKLYTDEKIEEMMKLLKDGVRRRPGRTGMALNYKDVEDARRDGLYLVRKARENKIENIANDPLRGMQDTKNSIHQSAVDATVGEVRQSGLDKTFQELEDEVEKLIDERNDVDRIRHDREENEEEKTKKAEEEQEQAKKAEEQEQIKKAEEEQEQAKITEQQIQMKGLQAGMQELGRLLRV